MNCPATIPSQNFLNELITEFSLHRKPTETSSGELRACKKSATLGEILSGTKRGCSRKCNFLLPPGSSIFKSNFHTENKYKQIE